MAVNTDYGPALSALLRGTSDRKPGANAWFALEAARGAAAFRDLFVVDSAAAFMVASTLPAYASQIANPLQVLNTTDPLVPANLIPLQTQQGFTCWYWVKAQITGTDGGAAVVLIQQFWTGSGVTAAQSAATSSVWAVYGGMVLGSETGSGSWITLPTVFLDNAAVILNSTGLTINKPGVLTGSVSVSAGQDAKFSVSLTYVAAAASIVLNAGTSARGPTFEQAGGNVAASGPFQSGYWSIVDGRASCNLQAPGNGATVSGTSWVWLDNQQFGLQRLPGALQAAQALTLRAPVPTNSLRWLWLNVQTNATQFNVFVGGSGKILKQFAAGKPVAVTTGHVWVTGQAGARHDVPATVQLRATYAGAVFVPREVAVTIDGATWVLQSTCAPSSVPSMWQTLPNYNPLAAYESPCDVFSITKTTLGSGVIEWQVPQANAAAAAKAIGVPAYTQAFGVSTVGILTVTAACALAAMVAVGIVWGVWRKRHYGS
jgi:hypothetical protein